MVTQIVSCAAAVHLLAGALLVAATPIVPGRDLWPPRDRFARLLVPHEEVEVRSSRSPQQAGREGLAVGGCRWAENIRLAIARYVAPRLPSLRHCVSGPTVVVFSVTDAGHIEDVRTPLEGGEVAACLEDEMERWRIPVRLGGAHVQLDLGEPELGEG